MSDERLRELERAWQASGLPEDGAAWWREALRAGLRTRLELEVAAVEGDPPARLAAAELSEVVFLVLIRASWDAYSVMVHHLLQHFVAQCPGLLLVYDVDVDERNDLAMRLQSTPHRTPVLLRYRAGEELDRFVGVDGAKEWLVKQLEC